MPQNEKSLSDLDIAAYLEGRMSERQRRRVEEHLANDERAADDFTVINKINKMVNERQEGGPVPEHLVRKVIEAYPPKKKLYDAVIMIVNNAMKVIQSSGDLSISVPAPVLGLRNSEVISPTMLVITKYFDEITAEFDIEKTGGDACNIKVIVSEGLSSSAKPDQNLRVELISEGRELISEVLKNGEALFEDIAPGRYNISLLGNNDNEILGEMSLKIE